MTDSLNILNQVAPLRQENNPRTQENEAIENGPGFAFSLTNAVLTLERNSARLLEVYGALPGNGTDAIVEGDEATQQSTRRSDFSSSIDTPLNSSNTGRGQNIITTPTDTPSSRTQVITSTLATNTILDPAPANSASSGAIPVAVQSPANISTLAPTLASAPTVKSSSNQNNTASVQNTAAPTNQSAFSNNVSLARHTQQSQSQSAVQESFTRLIANRLASGDTRFEVRLDPPELGRVDIRLESGERSSLNLTFENQSSLDLFRRDEQALRALLSESGLELSDNFEISFEYGDFDNLDKQSSSSSNEENAAYPQNNSSQNSTTALTSSLIPIPEGLLYADHPLNMLNPYADMQNSDRLLDIQI